MAFQKKTADFKDLDSTGRKDAVSSCQWLQMERSKWSDIEIKDDCQVACCGLRAHAVSYSQLSERVQRYCDIGQCVYKKGALEHSRRVLRVKKRRTQVVPESPKSQLPRCDNFGP